MNQPMAYKGVLAQLKKNTVLLYAARELAADMKAFKVEEHENVMVDYHIDFHAHFENKERAEHFVAEFKKLEKRPTMLARYTVPACR